eukprot:TRINITY_DN293_c0_g2_i1.p1 TRINITY_DN293_c0_g2~~TRINITY_DN293_c0_g2_i1.p1  ORF type:complete len:202 (+),score=32.08 TRINITY_DN293_c0_g2_i1:346-951(+)
MGNCGVQKVQNHTTLVNNNKTRDYDYLFKFLVIGDSGVGKSSLLSRYVDDVFTDDVRPNVGVDFKIKTTNINGTWTKLQIWDTAGQERFREERFRAVTGNCYRGGHAVVIVYDVTDRESFQNVTRWFQEIGRYACDNVLKILVGNKSDLEDERVVPYEEGHNLAESLSVDFYETSAKTCYSVADVFESSAKILVDLYNSEL